MVAMYAHSGRSIYLQGFQLRPIHTAKVAGAEKTLKQLFLIR